MKKYIYLLFSIVLLLVIIACSACTSSNSNQTIDYKSYSSVTTYIDQMNGFISYINDVYLYDDKYYVLITYFSEDDNYVTHELLTISYDGEIEKTLDLPEDCNCDYPADIGNGNLIIKNTSNQFVFIDINSGNINKIIDNPDNAYFVDCFGDGYFLFKKGSIEKYNYNDEKIGEIICSDWNYYYGNHPCFLQNEKDYVVSYTSNGVSYYELDFNLGICEYKFSLADLDIYPDCYGQYLIDENFEYEIDVKNMMVNTLYSWNYTDIKPETKNTNSINSYVFSDISFARVYSYVDSSHEINFYSYDETINNSNKIPIVIGGFNINYDLAMRIAVYEFNVSQTEYRAIIEDYAIEFGFSTYQEADVNTARLISYFESGNAPDIYYGNYFDYSYMGLNGMVIDMNPYIQSEGGIFDDMKPNIRDLMISPDGKCYSVFSGYTVSGYFGLENEMGDSISFEQLVQYYGDTGIRPIEATCATNLVDVFWGKSLLLTSDLNNEQLAQVVEFSLEYGVEDGNMYVYYPDETDVMNQTYALCYDYINGLDDVIRINDIGNGQISFVGFPTVNGSVHMATPYGQVAISSQSEYSDIALEIISILFEEDTQNSIAQNTYIPVKNSSLEYIISNSNEAKIEDIILLNMWIESVDAVAFYDWGISQIIYEEVNSYYSLNKPVDEIVDSLTSRIDLYYGVNH